MFDRILKIRGKHKKIKQDENVDVILTYCNDGVAKF